MPGETTAQNKWFGALHLNFSIGMHTWQVCLKILKL